MADKLEPGIAVTPTFVEGESPSPAKLNSISAQMKHAAEQLEKAIGDVHGQSAPYASGTLTTLNPAWGRNRTTGVVLSSTTERLTDIANIARLIGPSSNMNPRMLSSESITENVPAGVHQFSLRFPPEGPVSTSVTFSDAAKFANFQPSADLVSSGDYHVSDDGVVYVADETTGGTVTYITDPSTYAGGFAYAGSSFNAIPGPNQLEAGGNGLSFSAPDSNGRRTATLPLATHAQSDINGTSTSLDDEDPIYNQQLELPEVLGSLTAGDEIPAGFLYIKNYTTGEIYDSATYYYNDQSSVIIGGVDLTDDITAGHKFYVVTVGTNITTSIDDIRQKMFHSHSREFGEPFIDAEHLVGWTKYAGNSGHFTKSEIPGNFAPQYLHRDGYRAGFDDANANDANVMRGDLVIGLAGGSPGNYLGSGESHKLIFGGVGIAQAEIYRDSSNDFWVRTGVSGSDLKLGSKNSTEFRGIGSEIDVVLGTNCAGIRGDAGDSSNAIKFYYYNGTISPTGADDTIIVADMVPKRIVGFTFMIRTDDSNGSHWLVPNGSSSAGQDIFVWIDDESTATFKVKVGDSSQYTGTGGGQFRMVIFYVEE